MVQYLIDRFPAEFSALRELFGPASVDNALPRLREIHDYTEAKWQSFADQIAEGVVRYVLIAEAPPWSDEGTPQFLLGPLLKF